MKDAYRVAAGLVFFWFVIGVLINALTDWVVIIGTERYDFGALIMLSSVVSLIVGAILAHPSIIKNWLRGK